MGSSQVQKLFCGVFMKVVNSFKCPGEGKKERAITSPGYLSTSRDL
jgi:hypothetical protein